MPHTHEMILDYKDIEAFYPIFLQEVHYMVNTGIQCHIGMPLHKVLQTLPVLSHEQPVRNCQMEVGVLCQHIFQPGVQGFIVGLVAGNEGMIL